MGLITLFIGLIVVVSLHQLMRYLANATPTQAKTAFKWLAIIGGIVALLLIARFGAPLIAMLLGLLALAATWFNRLMALAPLAAMLRKKSGAAASSATMTDAEARNILGVSENATHAEIKAAYQQLIKKYHPDQGGSDYFARRLNEARNHLLKR